MGRRIVSCFAFLLFLALISTRFSEMLYQQAAAGQLSETNPEADSFRAQRLSEEQLKNLILLQSRSAMPPGELLTIFFSEASGSAKPADSWDAADYVKWKQLMLRENPEGFRRVSAWYGAVWNDVLCFPVQEAGTVYENSWMFERSYGGQRGHEGTDLMPPENLPGHYQVVSMTDGVVEQIGWLPLGGYRIGIRSPSGGYFYYAHLDSYSRAFQIGENITAGTVLGLMGNTGYGPEGTRGRFDVHLHLGIYIRTETLPELSVNPYWVLRYAQMVS